MFSHKTLSRGDRHISLGTNVLYSAATLVGILSQRLTNPDSIVAVPSFIDALAERLAAAKSVGDLGAGLWALCLAGDSRSTEFAKRIARSGTVTSSTTMELGLALTGLAEHTASGSGSSETASAAERIAVELDGRFGKESRVFAATAQRSHLIPDGRYTSFASQVYPLHGLAKWQAISGHDYSAVLEAGADTLVSNQGPLGQWWWFYSTVDGSALEGYPVYSVHQDAMAFMALEPIRHVGGPDHRAALARGLHWMFGANELGEQMYTEKPPMLYRCIQRRGSDADGFAGMRKRDRPLLALRSYLPASARQTRQAPAEKLEVLMEVRSYHLGWLLYSTSLIAGG